MNEISIHMYKKYDYFLRKERAIPIRTELLSLIILIASLGVYHV